MNISIDDVIQLKNKLKSSLNASVHFHDACQRQYFTLEQNSPELTDMITKFFLEKGANVIFSENKLQFTLTKGKQ